MSRENHPSVTVLKGPASKSETSQGPVDPSEFVSHSPNIKPLLRIGNPQLPDLSPRTTLQGPCEGRDHKEYPGLRVTRPLSGPSESAGPGLGNG